MSDFQLFGDSESWKLKKTTECLIIMGKIFCSGRREHHQSKEEKGKVGEMRYVTKLRDSELSIRWIDRSIEERERSIHDWDNNVIRSGDTF